MTTVNAGIRAFLGGVRVAGQLDWTVTSGWGAGTCVAEMVSRLGGTIVDRLEDSYPTVLVGQTDDDVRGRVVIRTTWNGWAAVSSPPNIRVSQNRPSIPCPALPPVGWLSQRRSGISGVRLLRAGATSVCHFGASTGPGLIPTLSALS